MSKDKNQHKTSVPKVNYIRIGESKKKKTKSFIEFASEYTKKMTEEGKSSFEESTFTIPTGKIHTSDSHISSVNTAQGYLPTEKLHSAISTNEDISKYSVNLSTSVDSFNQPEKEDSVFFPRFLRKQQEQQKVEKKEHINQENPNQTEFIKLLTTTEKAYKDDSKDRHQNLNSLSSIFNKDSAVIAGVQRVFRKSMTMMIISSFLFTILSFLSFRLFSVNLLIVLLVQILFIVFTNIFYIIVADKSYVWLGIAFQGIVFLIVHTIMGIGAGFSIPTIVSVALIIFLIYMSYLDVEKTQLSSRLFSINHITSDSTRMLSTAVSLVLAIGMFNSIVAHGTGNFLRKEVFKNDFIVDNLIIGKEFPGLNRFMLTGATRFENADELVRRGVWQPVDPDSNINLLSFIVLNYEVFSTETILSDREKSDLKFLPSDKAALQEKELVRNRAEEVNKIVFASLGYSLDDVLTSEKFKNVVRETYIYKVNRFESGDNNLLGKVIQPFTEVSITLVPRTYIIPGFFAVFVLFASFIANLFLKFLIKIFTLLVWFLLRKIDYARIDIEKVEAEVVTI